MGQHPGLVDAARLIARGAIAACALLVGAASAPAQGAPEMLRVAAGAFTMGRDDGPEDERPAHQIALPAFAIDRLKATNAEFAAFLNAIGLRNARGERLYDDDDRDARIHRRDGSWRADPGYEDHPVVEASWAGARDFCRWRGKRLPSEAEWERAARGSDGRRFPWGDAPPDSRRARFGVGWNQTMPVTSHPAGASAVGAIGMAGNAWEWVASAYRPYPYRADDGREDQAAGPVRGTRGGGHDSRAEELTTTQRGHNLSRNPAAGHHNIGFRCAR